MNIPGKGAKKIRWSRGEAAEAVARRFLAENQLPESHLQDTLQYVQLVMASAAPAAAAGSADYSYPAVDWSEEDHDLLETRRRPGAGRAGLRAAARLRGGADRRPHALRPGHAGASILMRPRSHFIFAGISYVDFFYVLIY